jgi:hypothetical protein
MKRIISVGLLTVGLAALLTGCSLPHGRCGTGLLNGSCQSAPENCASCGQCGQCGEVAGGQVCDDGQGVDPSVCAACPACHGHGCRLCCHRGRDGDGGGVGAPGPATGAVTYPYYTLRGPRDFLARSPRPLGP